MSEGNLIVHFRSRQIMLIC